MRLSTLAISATVLLASSACSGGGTPNGATTPSTGPGQASSLTPSTADATPTSPDQLPDPAPTAPPVGSKVLYTGSGNGARDLTLPASAGKASHVSVSWSCAGPAKFGIVSGGKTLAESGCGDGSAVFTVKIPRTAMGERLSWKFIADSSVVWRVSVLQPPES